MTVIFKRPLNILDIFFHTDKRRFYFDKEVAQLMTEQQQQHDAVLAAVVQRRPELVSRQRRLNVHLVFYPITLNFMAVQIFLSYKYKKNSLPVISSRDSCGGATVLVWAVRESNSQSGPILAVG